MRTVTRPDFFYRYVTIDPGVRNHTGILLAYVDFLRGVIVVEAEALLQGEQANTENIADTIHALERRVWGESRMAGGHPVTRYSDVELRLIMDLRRDHGLDFRKIEKKDPDGDMRAWRAALQAGTFEVSEECPRLIDQMRNSVLNTKGTDLALESNGGHYDLIPCGRFLVKVANLRGNPFPEGYRTTGRTNDVYTPYKPAETGLLPQTSFGRRAAEWLKNRR